MQAQVQIMLYQPNRVKVQDEKKAVPNLRSMEIVGFEQIPAKLIEIFVL